MKVFITGHKGFIAKNLVWALEALGHSIVHPSSLFKTNNRGEPCVFRNTEDAWSAFFTESAVDYVIHNAALVGTDVVALNPHEATLSNVMGTHTICRAARQANKPVCYMGTSVIYDTPKYQNEPISETSDISPGTFYGAQKLAGEHIVKSTAKDWLIMRPLFAFGGVGDMNSLPAKTFFAHRRGLDKLSMFLDPKKSKDYMHVDDFCDAVALACHNGLWGNDFNVSAERPLQTGKIVDLMSEICGSDLNALIDWHPETDYLGNHLLTSEKFRRASNWQPSLTLESGLQQSWRSIKTSTANYDPLRHLDSAKQRGLDLKQFFPKAS